MSIGTTILKEHIEGLYQKLSEFTHQTPEAFHLGNFELRDRNLYHKGKGMPLAIREEEAKIGWCHSRHILGKEGLHELGFNIPKSS